MILFTLLTRTILRRFQEELHSCFLHAGDHTVTMLLKNGLSKPFGGAFHRCSRRREMMESMGYHDATSSVIAESWEAASDRKICSLPSMGIQKNDF
jgi:hypothetical protein